MVAMLVPEVAMSGFAEWLHHVRETRGLSNRQIAVYADVSPTTVGLWLKGAQEPERDSVKKLARGLHVDADMLRDLVEGRSDEYPKEEEAIVRVDDPTKTPRVRRLARFSEPTLALLETLGQAIEADAKKVRRLKGRTSHDNLDPSSC